LKKLNGEKPSPGKRKRRRWKQIWLINRQIDQLALKTNKSWIQKINKFKLEFLGNFNEDAIFKEKGWIYLMYNLQTKRVYVGQTSKSLFERYKSHEAAFKFDKNRTTYQYFRKFGFHSWIITPLLKVNDIRMLDIEEKRAMHYFRELIINDSYSWGLVPKFKNKTMKAKDIERLNFLRLRSKITNFMIFKICFDPFEKWRLWKKDTIFKYLCEIKKFGKKKNLARKSIVRLISNLKTKYGIKIKENYILKINKGTNNIKSKLLRWIKNEIDNKYEKSFQSKFIKKSIKIVEKKQIKMSQIINNSRVFLNENNNTCNCKEYEFEKDKDGHILCRTDQIPEKYEKLKKILQKNSNSGLLFSGSENIRFQIKVIKEALNVFNIQDWKNESHQELYSILCENFQWNFKRYSIDNFHGYVKSIIKPFQKDICFVEVDKNARSWCLICPKRYIERTNEAFQEENLYKKINEKEINQEENNMRRDYPWNSIITLFKGTFGNARILPKNKDLEKSRPLVSFFKFPARMAGKIAARCLTKLVNWAGNKLKSMDLKTTEHFINFIKNFNNYNNKNKTNTNKDLFFWKFDIENHFTNLDINKVKIALDEILEQYTFENRKSIFSIHRHIGQKDKDCFGIKRHRDFRLISFEELKKYIHYELNYPIFSVGKTFYKQVNGLPMGSFVAPGLAVLFCIWAEWKINLRNSYDRNQIDFIRYKDDILAITFHNSKEMFERTAKDLENIYGNGLKIKQEAIDKNRTNFLEYILNYNKINKKLEMSVLNKNDMIMNKIFNCNFYAKIVNYPEIDLMVDKVQIIGIIIGIIKKINRNSNSIIVKKISIKSILNELKLKKYPKNWIKSAIWKTNSWNFDKIVWIESFNEIFLQ
jgi:hypothetical protein